MATTITEDLEPVSNSTLAFLGFAISSTTLAAIGAAAIAVGGVPL